MADRKRLVDEEISRRLGLLHGWSVADGKLHKEFRFRDFAQAFAFMTAGALIAERMNHHPEWFNVYNRLVIDLTTHSAGGISELDFEFAAGLESVAAEQSEGRT
jgi:4a-hydroxytetrahydrobiopterin dehydratase